LNTIKKLHTGLSLIPLNFELLTQSLLLKPKPKPKWENIQNPANSLEYISFPSLLSLTKQRTYDDDGQRIA
jgi:hypothetical protein